MKSLLFLYILLFSSYSLAGFFEISASASLRLSEFSDVSQQKTRYYTGSVAYYFFEMSALEISHTQGQSELTVEIANIEEITTSIFEHTSADILINFAKRDAPFKPYIKLGIGFIKKRIYREQIGFGRDEIGDEKDREGRYGPSGGLGLKLKLTKHLHFKVGIDAWANSIEADDDDFKVDYVGKAGVSWLF